MQPKLKEHIANAISLSFIETMKKKAPELEEKILNGEIQKIEFLPVKIEGKTHLKCQADAITFTFPLKPIFLQKIAEKKEKITSQVKKERKDKQNVF